jgi:hypothetical protein
MVAEGFGFWLENVTFTGCQRFELEPPLRWRVKEEAAMKSRIVLLMLMAGLAAMGAGCIAVVIGGAAAGAGTYVWVSGEMRSTESVAYDQAWDAAMAGLKDLHFTITDQDKGAAEGTITARGTSDAKVKVTVRKVTGTLSEFRIRVGTVGNKSTSEQILDKIKTHF